MVRIGTTGPCAKSRAAGVNYLMSWLSEGQAKAIAEALNDIAGYEWHTRHPEWFGRVTE